MATPFSMPLYVKCTYTLPFFGEKAEATPAQVLAACPTGASYCADGLVFEHGKCRMPSPPPGTGRTCDATPCVDGDTAPGQPWANSFGHTCAKLRQLNAGAPDWTDADGHTAGDHCCQFCP